MLAERIRQLLKENRQSVTDLARHTGVSAQAAHKWLSGVNEPRGRHKGSIATFFGMTLQELEYGPLVSLAPIASTLRRLSGKLDPAIADSTASLLIESEINGTSRSPEYQLGMRHGVILRLCSVKHDAPYQPGTCQLDAYESGIQHGLNLIDRLQSDPA